MAFEHFEKCRELQLDMKVFWDVVKKPESQRYQGAVMLKKPIAPPTPCKVALSQTLYKPLHFYFAINSYDRVNY